MEGTPWEEHVDEETGAPFYFNPETGVTQWERPEELGPPPEGEEAEQPAVQPEDVEINEANNLENWAEAQDPETGAIFYYNAVTEESQWEPPPGWPTGQKADVQEADHVDSESPTNQSAQRQFSRSKRKGTISMQKKHNEPQTVEEKLAARSRKFIQMRKSEKLGSKAAAFASNSPMQTSRAVDGNAGGENGTAWEAATDPDSGATYYFNPQTGETRWDPPE